MRSPVSKGAGYCPTERDVAEGAALPTEVRNNGPEGGQMIDMNLLEHALYAAAFQAMIGFLTGNWWAGAALASSYFIGREVAQAEYRWIEYIGGGLRANMPWNAVFDRRVWENSDQIADWLGPLITTVTIAFLAGARAKRPDGDALLAQPGDEADSPPS